MCLNPRESAQYIATNADHVKINTAAIPALAEKFYDSLRDGKFGDTWDAISLHPKGEGTYVANWYISTLILFYSLSLPGFSSLTL